jgi:hypothetical protein
VASDGTCTELLWSYSSLQYCRARVLHPRDEDELAAMLRRVADTGHKLSIRGDHNIGDKHKLSGFFGRNTRATSCSRRSFTDGTASCSHALPARRYTVPPNPTANMAPPVAPPLVP